MKNNQGESLKKKNKKENLQILPLKKSNIELSRNANYSYHESMTNNFYNLWQVLNADGRYGCNVGLYCNTVYG